MPENLPLGQTTQYQVQMAHSHDEGLCVSPIAGPPRQNASVVRLYAPIERLSVYWQATSEGKPPLVPSHKIYTRNGNRLFLGGERYGIITPSMAGHYFTMAGVLHFAIIAPEDLDSPFSLARCPWEQSALSEFTIPADNFLDQGIVNDGWSQPPGILPDNDVPFLNSQLMNPLQG